MCYRRKDLIKYMSGINLETTMLIMLCFSYSLISIFYRIYLFSFSKSFI